MKNEYSLKKRLFLYLLFSLLFILLLLGLHKKEYQTYTKQWNQKLEAIIIEIQKKYPNLTKNEIIDLLNQETNLNSNSLSIYGIDIQKDSYILQNEKEYHKYTVFILLLAGCICTCFTIMYLYCNKKTQKNIRQITNYLEEINNKNYQLAIEENKEDELSILKNEIYKTTILLKETAENSLKDKIKLKETLSDISHQLKTPLTSMLISLDNIIENPNMPSETKTEFIKAIKRETVNISFLVQNLLKLTKFDANTIKFYPQKSSINSIMKEAIQNVALIAEIKNIKIVVPKNQNFTILCDKKWQTEAWTNILKNCIEHSKEQSSIHITANDNKLYSEIIIKDQGSGIDKKDLPHIFKRFYKSKSSSSESIGIGLSLAKSIIEKDHGFITVESKLGVGTKFTIKYFKNEKEEIN